MDIVNKISLSKKDQVFNDILDLYNKKGYTIVNFIYFASLSKYIEEETNETYKKALLNGDFILPDGIALKIYLKYKYKKNMEENLNGTDFTPYLIDTINKQGKSLHLAYYTVYDEKIGKPKTDFEKVKEYIVNTFKTDKIDGFVSHYTKRGEDFDFDRYKESISDKSYDVKLFLVGIGSPFQEMWVEKNRQFFEENNILVMNIGGLFDFWTNFEKRAPKLILKLNLEWLWRLGQNPKKNWTKVKESFKVFKKILKK